MAEDKDRKTQQASSHKIKKALEKGQIPRSKEVVGAAVLAAAFVVIKYQGGGIFNGLGKIMAKTLGQQYGINPINAMRAASLDGMMLLLPIFAAAVVIGIASSVAQGGLVWKPFELKFNAFDPISGLKRKFSAEGAHEVFKSVLKFVSGTVVFYFVMKQMVFSLPMLTALGLHAALAKTYEMAVLLIKAGLLWLAIIAAISYFLERKRYNDDMKMSKEDVKEENKELNGDPQVKRRIRMLQFQMFRKRMLSAVPKATVVITNPTHFAVALLYEKGMGAPKIVAKGADHLAARIKEIAREHGVPVIEDKLLARTLYKLELDSFVPAELYKAVAKIIARVYKLKGMAAA